MKKAKRVVALVLVFAVVAVFLTVNAYAASPRGIACDSCGSSNTKLTSWTKTETVYVGSGMCSNIPAAHTHIKKTPMRKFKCNNCGYTYDYAAGSSTTTCG